MIFIGTPNMLVTHFDKRRKKNLPLFRFDTDGNFETQDESIIKLLKGKFEVAEEKQELNPEKSEAEDKVVCKKCGRDFESKGLFLAHCRKEHKKDGDG